MSTQIQPESNIPPQIYELATRYGLGTPLQRQQRRSIQILLILELLFGFALIGWFGYTLYGYIAFSFLSHTYPNADSVPDNQLATYFWLQALHDHFWLYMLQIVGLLFTLLSQYATFSLTYRTKLYLCTEGLLKLYKKKEEAVRWDEVQELFLTNGHVSELGKQDGEDVFLPHLLLAGRRNKLNTVIIEEVTTHLLPQMLASYERGEMIPFGDLEISQQGIFGPDGLVEWAQIGDITHERYTLSVYYRERALDWDEDGQARRGTGTWRWHTWQKSALTSASWPNLPIFVALVKTILDQRDENQNAEEPFSLQVSTLKETAALTKRKCTKNKRLAIALAILSALTLFSLLIGIPLYQSIQEDQRVARDTQLLQNYFTNLAHHPYTVHVPGEHCGNGNKFWLDDDPKNVYTCQKDGLLMTQRDMQYTDGEWLTFVPTALSNEDAFTSVNYFPHHYRIQVKATILSHDPSTCVAIEFHIQDFQGMEAFNVCAGGGWNYYRCDMQCNTTTTIASGNLPHLGPSYVMSVDVSDSVLTFQVNQTYIASIADNTYTSTNQLQLTLDGDPHTSEPISALFSDFTYTPLP